MSPTIAPIQETDSAPETSAVTYDALTPGAPVNLHAKVLGSESMSCRGSSAVHVLNGIWKVALIGCSVRTAFLGSKRDQASDTFRFLVELHESKEIDLNSYLQCDLNEKPVSEVYVPLENPHSNGL